jgi:acetyl-CoA carboxylase biotin carboxylase subunit
MIGKLITYGRNREIAMDRMYRALGEFIISGIKTTIPFSKAIMQDPVFRNGKATTKFIEEFVERANMDTLLQSNHNIE